MKGKLSIEQKKLALRFQKRKRVLERYMKQASVVRFIDKISFIVGVLLVISTAFILGRFPNDIYYKFHTYTIMTLVLIRLMNYRMKRWHYYLFDFCYFANSLMIYFLNFDPKNDILFKVFFCLRQRSLWPSNSSFQKLNDFPQDRQPYIHSYTFDSTSNFLESEVDYYRSWN